MVKAAGQAEGLISAPGKPDTARQVPPSVILPAVFAICSMGSRALLTIRYPPREAERMIKGV